jgi:hypothetical protein
MSRTEAVEIYAGHITVEMCFRRSSKESAAKSRPVLEVPRP